MSEENDVSLISEEFLKEIEPRLADSKAQVELRTTNPPSIAVSLPAGREKRRAVFRDTDTLRELMSYPVEDINCVGNFAAICSYEEGWIEALIEPVGIVAISSLFKVLFDVAPYSEDKRHPIVLERGDDVQVTLEAEPPRVFRRPG